MECEMPLVNSNPAEMKEIFESVKTIAILGLSPDESKASNMVAISSKCRLQDRACLP